MNQRRLKWLNNELPKLVNEGILSPEDAQKLRSYYNVKDESNSMKMALAIFGVLGAILISAGIILVLARNWSELSRPVRTVISIIPLLVGQVMCGWVLLRRNHSVPWREGMASFLFISIGTAISLIGQTYNIPGDVGSYVLTWMLLGFPLIYLMNTTVPSLFYLVGIIVWAASTQIEGGQALLFWVLLGLLIPYIFSKIKQSPFSNHSVFLLWSVSVALCIAIGITLEKVLPGLWIIVYSSYFVALYLAGILWFKHAPTLWQRPFQVVGGAGILVISYMLTFRWPWINIGWSNYRYQPRYHEWAGYFDYLIAACLTALALYLIYVFIRRKNMYPLLFGCAAILSIAAYIGVIISNPMVAIVLYNLFLLSVGIGTVIRGVLYRQLGTTNGGMIIISLLAIMRFFDSSLGFVERGIAFILVGVGFLVSNVLIIKKQKEANDEH